MNFLSFQYAFFLTITFFIFYSLPQKNQWKFLLAASIFFYMFFIPKYIVVPLIIGLISFASGLLIEKTKSSQLKRIVFLSSLISNAGILIVFKYIDFLMESVFAAVNLVRSGTFSSLTTQNPWALNLIIPLGISYITFQAIGYTIEIYRGNHAAEKNLGIFLTYILFFPKVFSGPIERAHNFLPQLHQEKVLDYKLVSDGLKLIVWGLFKKMIIAEQLSLITSKVLNQPDAYQGIPLIVSSLIFTIQLYADFSGYTDIAIGSANVLGFDLMKNFNFPLISKSTTELWRRWHISLSTWFNEYVYNPIAIAKRDWGIWAAVYATLITFLILGIWHGSSWKFVVFGLLQWVVLTGEILTKKFRKKLCKELPELFTDCFGVVFTFSFFSFSAIFFRSENLTVAMDIVKHLFIFSDNTARVSSLFSTFSIREIISILFLISLLLITEYIDRNFDFRELVSRRRVLVRWGFYYAIIISLIIFGVGEQTQFIYFKF